jgi:hypothetical protein
MIALELLVLFHRDIFESLKSSLFSLQIQTFKATILIKLSTYYALKEIGD